MTRLLTVMMLGVTLAVVLAVAAYAGVCPPIAPP
jgi:hypothetical protein